MLLLRMIKKANRATGYSLFLTMRLFTKFIVNYLLVAVVLSGRPLSARWNTQSLFRALTLDIGFYRKMCKDDPIRSRSVRRFQFTHAQREIGNQITFVIEQKHLAGWKNDFKKYIGVVQKYPAPYAG